MPPDERRRLELQVELKRRGIRSAAPAEDFTARAGRHLEARAAGAEDRKNLRIAKTIATVPGSPSPEFLARLLAEGVDLPRDPAKKPHDVVDDVLGGLRTGAGMATGIATEAMLSPLTTGPVGKVLGAVQEAGETAAAPWRAAVYNEPGANESGTLTEGFADFGERFAGYLPKDGVGHGVLGSAGVSEKALAGTGKRLEKHQRERPVQALIEEGLVGDAAWGGALWKAAQLARVGARTGAAGARAAIGGVAHAIPELKGAAEVAKKPLRVLETLGGKPKHASRRLDKLVGKSRYPSEAERARGWEEAGDVIRKAGEKEAGRDLGAATEAVLRATDPESTDAELKAAIDAAKVVDENEALGYYAPDEILPTLSAEDLATEGRADQVVIRAELLQRMAGMLERPLKVGRTRGARGYFVRKTHPAHPGTAEVVRIRDAGDLEAAAHEVGHGMELQYHYSRGYGPDDLVKARASMQGDMGDASMDLLRSLDPKGHTAEEGFSQLVARWLHGRTEGLDPRLLDWFETKVVRSQKHWARELPKLRRDLNVWRTQGPHGRALGDMDIDGTITKALRPSMGRRVKRKVRKLRARWENAWFPLQHAEDVAKKAGVQLDQVDSPHEAAMFVDRRSGHRAQEWVTGSITDRAGNPVGPGLAHVLRPVSDNIQDAMVYLKARRTQDLNGIIAEYKLLKDVGEDGIAELRQAGKYDEALAAHKIETGMSVDDADKLVDSLRTPEREAFVHNFTEMSVNALRYTIGDGMTEQGFARIVDELMLGGDDLVAVYAPMKRIIVDQDFSFLGKAAERTTRRWHDLPDPLRGITGSSRPTQDPRDAMMNYWAHFISTADRNWVGRKLVRMAEQMEGGGNLLERVGIRKIERETLDAMKAELRARLGDDVPDSDLNEMIGAFADVKQKPGVHRVVWPDDNGAWTAYEIDGEIFEALQGISPQTSDGVLKALFAAPARIRRLAVTGANPWFQILGFNPVRDMMQYLLYTKGSSWTSLPDLARGFFREFTWTKGSKEINRLFRTWGMDLSTFLGQDKRSVMGMAKQATMNPVKRRLYNIVRHPVDTFRELISFPERAVRKAEMERVGRMLGWTPGAKLDDATAVAMQRAGNDITLDFLRAGSTGRELNKFTAFFNAGVQGPAKLMRELRYNTKRTVVRGAALYTMPYMASWMYWKDKPEWQNAEPWLKYGFVWLPSESGQPWRVPLGFENAAFFGAFPMALVDTLYRTFLKSDPKAADSLVGGVEYLTGSVVPPVVPTAAEIILEQVANFSTFRKRQIESASLQWEPTQERVHAHTSATAKGLGSASKWLAEKLPQDLTRPYGLEEGISPVRIDYLIRQLGGNLGHKIIDYAERVAGWKEGKPEGWEPDPADNPWYGRFKIRESWLYQPPIDDLYNAYKDAIIAKEPQRAARLKRSIKRVNNLREAAYKELRYRDRIQGLADAADAAKKALR